MTPFPGGLNVTGSFNTGPIKCISRVPICQKGPTFASRRSIASADILGASTANFGRGYSVEIAKAVPGTVFEIEIGADGQRVDGAHAASVVDGVAHAGS